MVLLFRKVQICVKLQQEWWVCQTKETVRINHLPKEHFMDANKIRKGVFRRNYNLLKKYSSLFCRTVE
jgi:hypothetical protein